MMFEESDFRGRISHRLSLIFRLLFFVALLAAGASPYLARPIFTTTGDV